MILLLAFLAVDFNSQVKPILDSQCAACHDRAFFQRKKDRVIASLNFMPPGGPPLSAAAKATLTNWVNEGMFYPETRKALEDDLELTRILHRQITRTPAPKAPLKPYQQTIPGTSVSFQMMPIPGGKFTMGNNSVPDESPAHEVTVEPFFMAAHEVTWNEYRLFMFSELSGEEAGANIGVDAVSRPTKPYVEMSFGMGIEGYPAISMTHHAANKYAQWLSAKTGHFYRLPTEAEWEYACKANSPAPENLEEVAVFQKRQYEKVGTKKPNAFGLYDMLGNVMEWTADQYYPDAYRNPQPWYPSKTPYPHTARGGSWADSPKRVTCTARFPSDPSWKQQDPNLPKSIWYHTDALGLGFRLVRPLKVPPPEEMHRFWNNGVAEDQ
jgi:formylglycine-generating enzyme required for sulfatase activity